MSVILTHGSSAAEAAVLAYKKALAVVAAPRQAGYSVSGITGTIAAALGSLSSVFAMRPDPAAGATYKANIYRLRLTYTTIVAYTVPITAGRRLALFRGAGAAPSGGTTLVAVKKDSADGASEFNAAGGGIISIATTGALTVAGITFEADPLRTLTLVHVGAAGGFIERVWEFSVGDAGGPIPLNQGEVLAIRNPAAMDAAGTWQLGVDVDWDEGT